MDETKEVTTTPEVDTETSEEEVQQEDKKEEPVFDWKQIAEDERQRRFKAEKALAEDRYARRHELEETTFDQTESQPLTELQLRKILREEREATEKRFMGRDTERLAREIASSDEEASAIVEIYNSRSFPEYLTHEEKVKEAYYIAHGPRLFAKQDELKRSLRSKQTTKTASNENTHRDAPQAGAKVNPEVQSELNRLGFKWDGKRFSKKLANGKTLVRDPKTNKSFIEG